MIALFERDWSIKGKKVLDVSVEMIVEALVGFNANDTGRTEVGFPATPAA
jgi:hypothetical protein